MTISYAASVHGAALQRTMTPTKFHIPKHPPRFEQYASTPDSDGVEVTLTVDDVRDMLAKNCLTYTEDALAYFYRVWYEYYRRNGYRDAWLETQYADIPDAEINHITFVWE